MQRNDLLVLAKSHRGRIAHRPRSAGFQTCCIADFQIGSAAGFRARAISQASRVVGPSAGLETRDTADLEVCATGAVRGCARHRVALGFGLSG